MLFSGPVNSVVVPGVDGDFQVFAGHAPVISSMRSGVVAVDGAEGALRLFVRGGFAEVNAAAVTILADHAVNLAEVDNAKLAADIRNAEEDVADANSDEARARAASRLDGLRALEAALG
jgi:F-type H+-transporting ATPase subunit epsilon